MNKTIFTFLFICFGYGFCYGQKVIQKEYGIKDVHTLSIEDDAVFKITVVSSKSTKIKMVLHVSGEHSENIVMEEKLINGTLFLQTGFTPFFVMENDKLAAHKVMSLQMEIFVPSDILVVIKSKLASVFTTGMFKNLAIVLENGECVVDDFMGDAHLKSTNGNIAVVARKNVSGQGVSKNGSIEIELSKGQQYTVFAESVNGNISMEQTK